MNNTEANKRFFTDSAGMPLFLSGDKCPTGIFAIDIDGTLTDGRVVITAGQKVSTSYSVIDGAGLAMLPGMNIKAVLVTHKANWINRNHRKRAEMLGINIYESPQKTDVIEGIVKICIQMFKQKPSFVAAIGDDLYDIGMISAADIGFCPHSAHSDVKRAVRHMNNANGRVGMIIPSQNPAGVSAVRYACEHLVQIANNWKQTGRI